MPAVNNGTLKKLLITQLLVSFALKRRLSLAQLEDLVERAMTDPRFDLTASSEKFADPGMTAAEAANWAEAVERSGKAAHLFSGSEAAEAKQSLRRLLGAKSWRK